MLRPLAISDAAHFLRVIEANRGHLGRFLPWMDELEAIGDIEEWMAPRVGGVEYDGELIYLINIRYEIAGMMSVERMDHANGSCEVGYWISKSHEGRGVVSNATRAFFDYLFGDHGMERVEVTMVPENRKSKAVAERLGMREEEPRVRPPDAQPPGPTHMAVYSVTKARWQKARRNG